MSLAQVKSDLIIDRARMMAAARSFFAQREVFEVDCDALTPRASVDAHIDLIPATVYGHDRWFLHSSPEYQMKILLSQGSGDIYQLAHVFRDGERGERHRLEFMMAEWYRVGFSFQAMIQETCDFIALFIGERPIRLISYEEAFTNVGIDYRKLSCDQVDLAFAERVEPSFDPAEMTVVKDWPVEMGAMAVIEEGVARRFEVFTSGLELANGYQELTDPVEQERRLAEQNVRRMALCKSPLPLDAHFLQALQRGIPDCCGVAVGFDRCMMARRKSATIDEVIATAEQ